MAKITKSGTTAAPVYTETATTLLDGVLLPVTSVLAMFSSTDATEFYSKDIVGVGSGVALAGGFVLGDIFGAKIPVLGGRR